MADARTLFVGKKVTPLSTDSWRHIFEYIWKNNKQIVEVNILVEFIILTLAHEIRSDFPD
jgi:hypothetical protein